MGCCASSEADDGLPQRPMGGGQVVGREQGTVITRDEARQRAAAAAEARAQTQNTRGQQGDRSKIRQPAASQSSGGNDGRVNISDPRAWD